MTTSTLVLICSISYLVNLLVHGCSRLQPVHWYLLLFEHVRLPGWFAFCAQMQQSIASHIDVDYRVPDLAILATRTDQRTDPCLEVTETPFQTLTSVE